MAAAVLTATAVGIWLATRGAVDPGPAPAPAAQAPAGGGPGPGADPVRADGAVPERPGERSEALPPVRTPSPATLPAQGLRGVVLDDRGQPLPGCDVHLVDSVGNEPLALPMLQRQRHAYGPVASTKTAADGTFALGLPVVQDKLYELYVLSEDHATERLGGLRLLAGQWHDLDPIRLDPGALLRGRVTVAGREDIPVPQAVVTVEIGSAFADAALRALPGGQHPPTAHVDATGAYELRHVASRGSLRVIASAPGFARVIRSNVQLTSAEPVIVDFGLSPGHAVSGLVVDDRGQPIAGARIEVWPRRQGDEPSFAASDDDGRFVVPGLSPGSYRLRVGARGFEQHDEPEIASDRADLHIVLAARSRLRVRVTGPGGDVLRRYQLTLRRVFPEQGHQLAAVLDVPEQRVQLDGLTDHALVDDVPVGLFVCQIDAEGYATTRSSVIDNSRAPGAPATPRMLEVDVVMSRGAALRGVVLDEAGRPLAGAQVVTHGDGAIPDSPLFRLTGGLPERITARRTTTAADGSYLLPLLALADYQLVVDHPDACRVIVGGLRLEREGERTVPPVRLPTGAAISGRVTVGGRIAGQVKVVLTTPVATPRGPDSVRLETATDADGRFRLPRRVPPGSYELRAAVVGTAAPEAMIFSQLMQLQQSTTVVTIAPGQSAATIELDLPTPP